MKDVKLLNHHCDGFLFKSTCTKSKIITSVNYRKELAEFHIEKRAVTLKVVVNTIYSLQLLSESDLQQS